MIRTKRVGFLVALTLASVIVAVGLILAQPPANAAGSGDLEWFGVVNSRPPGVVGTWVVGGMPFQADGNTEIEEQFGPLAVNACARVRYQVNGSVNTATKISSQEPYKCGLGGGGGHTGEHMKVYSYVNALPASFPVTLTGVWVIGNVSYTAVVTTEFDQSDGPFAVGKCVGVEYISDTNRLALELETVPAYRCASGAGGGGLPYAHIYGVVDQFPPGLVGTWQISGTIYTATASTHFEQEHGPFFAGGCVGVKYNSADRIAVEISTEEAYKCTGGGHPESKFYGIIAEIPTGTLGLWTIGGNTFVVTTSTQLEAESGMTLTVGMCAEVEYYLSGADKIATKIGQEDLYKCNNNTFTNVAHGRISSLPVGLYGTWVITRRGGFTDTFQATLSTEFEQNKGSFVPGACVKVKYYTQAGVNFATRISTKEAEVCGVDDDGVPPTLPGTSKVYARIDSFPPAPYTGEWVIGGVTYSATTSTHFEQDDGPFAISACVKAKYTVISNTNWLREVETEADRKCLRGGTGAIPEYSSYGVVEAFPPSLIGEWRVSGITYTSNSGTRFEQEHGFFAVGAFVEVKYIVSGTTNLAIKIETHVAPGAGRETISGTLESHSMSDDWSPWVINGVSYLADPAIEVGQGSQMPVVGQIVQLNVYQSSTGELLATSANRIYPLFLPMLSR